MSLTRKLVRTHNIYAESKSDIVCCHDIEEAVFRVQGPYLNIEQSQKMAEKSEKIGNK